MVLTKSELIASLQHEVRILLHLASKIDSAWLDYRPTPKQRSTIELLRYLSYMGPMLVKLALGSIDRADRSVWTTVQQAAQARNFEETLAEIATHADVYATLLGNLTDADFRAEFEGFRGKTTRGAFIVNLVLCGCAAYRTQLFLYLKACGREELTTSNLWAGVDAPVAV
jgi:hypothetical protein